MDKDMNKDDFMNDLYDYLWMPEDEQGALYLHQNILFGRAADRGENCLCNPSVSVPARHHTADARLRNFVPRRYPVPP